jgi:hypothetical protein
LRFFDTQREQWVDLDGKPSAETIMLHKRDGSIVPLPAPTRKQLAQHLEMVERHARSTKSLPERKAIISDTKRAIDEVARECGLVTGSLADTVRELRARRYSLAQIAAELALPQRRVRELLRSAALSGVAHVEEAGSEAAFLQASAANDVGEEGKPDTSPVPGNRRRRLPRAATPAVRGTRRRDPGPQTRDHPHGL